MVSPTLTTNEYVVLRGHTRTGASNSKFGAGAQYPARDGCVRLLERVRDSLGVNTYQFCQLIDYPIAMKETVYKWFSGKRRPSAFYVVRMTELLLLSSKGQLNLATFDPSTYWDSIGLGDYRV